MNFNVIIVLTYFVLVNSAVIDEVEEQGLYSRSDHVTILTRDNFDRKVYSQRWPLLVQFYNTYCGHCRAFAPKFKNAAADIEAWKNVVRLAVLDCSEEDNVEICRNFEVMAYPSLRYFHENYVKGNKNLGDSLVAPDTAQKFKDLLISKLQTEQSMGRIPFAPSLKISSYVSYPEALNDVPANVRYTFLIFEKENSTIGSELILDLSGYTNIKVKRVFDSCELANIEHITTSPALIAVKPDLQSYKLTPNEPTIENVLYNVNSFLKSMGYIFPSDANLPKDSNLNSQVNNMNLHGASRFHTNTVYYSDLEKTIKSSLHTEITRHKILTGEPLKALTDYLDVIITSFPFKDYHLSEYLLDIRNNLSTKNSWNGYDVYELVKSLETVHAPVYTSELEYIGCKGSQPKYRGYTCGLWELFHTLTVNAAVKSDTEGPKVLRAMHGYVKNFFGCTHCAEHFQEMAARNRIFDVKDNVKAVLWLWISHNEVNLRLAGDVTEDPEYPKIQFPSVTDCSECRLANGAWNLPAVYEYLQMIYGGSNIRGSSRARSAGLAPSFSSLDIGMLSLLYILSFVIILLVVKLFLTKRYYRKRIYKHGNGKV